MQWEMMSHFNENTKKSKPRCYFSLFCGAICNFSSLCCLNEKRNICGDITPSPAAAPPLACNHLTGGPLLHPFCLFVCLFFSWWYFACRFIHSQISAAWRHMLSPASADRADKKCVRRLYQMLERKPRRCCWLSLLCDAAFSVCLFVCFCLGIICATSKLMESVVIWAKASKKKKKKGSRSKVWCLRP